MRWPLLLLSILGLWLPGCGGEEPAKQPEPGDEREEQVQREESAESEQKLSRKTLEYISPGNTALVVIHPRKLLRSELAQSASLASLLDTFLPPKDQRPFEPEQLDRVMLLVSDVVTGQKPKFGVILSFADPVDRQKLLMLLPGAKETARKNVVYHISDQVQAPRPDALSMVDSRTVLLAEESMLLEMTSRNAGDDPLVALLEQADWNSDLILVSRMDNRQKFDPDTLGDFLPASAPQELQGLRQNLEGLILTANLSRQPLLHVQCRMSDANAATKLQAALQQAQQQQAQRWQEAKQHLDQMPAEARQAFQVLEESLTGMQVTADNWAVNLEVAAPQGLGGYLKNNLAPMLSLLASARQNPATGNPGLDNPPEPEYPVNGEVWTKVSPPVPSGQVIPPRQPDASNQATADFGVEQFNFRVFMTGQPLTSRETREIPEGQVVIEKFESEHEGSRWTVNVVSYPDGVTGKLGSRALATRYLDELTEQGELKEREDGLYRGYFSADYTYTHPGRLGPGNPAVGRVVVVGDRLYDLQMVGIASNFIQETQRFFDSLMPYRWADPVLAAANAVNPANPGGPNTPMPMPGTEPRPATPAAPAIAFQPLPAEWEVTTFALTDGAEQLVVAHEAAGKLTVWNPFTRELVKTIDCEGPAAVLCRKKQVFVARPEIGVIEVYDRDEDYKLVRTVDSGVQAPFYLSAPMGGKFSEEILVTGGGNRRQVSVVKVRAGKNTLLQEGSFAAVTVDTEGAYVFIQGNLTRGSGNTTVKAYEEFTTDGRKARAQNVKGVDSLFYQVHKDGYWFSHNNIHRPDDLSAMLATENEMLIPDYTAPALYLIKGGELTARKLDTSFAFLGKRPLQNAFSTEIPIERNGNRYRTPVALTVNGKLTFFVYDPARKAVAWAETQPFLELQSASQPGTNTPEENAADAADKKLKLARQLIEKRNKSLAKKWLEEIVRDYPDTAAAREALELLQGL